MIKILGTVRGVSVKSKVDTDNRVLHNISIQLELSSGMEHVQQIVELVKKIATVEIDARQPSLDGMH